MEIIDICRFKSI